MKDIYQLELNEKIVSHGLVIVRVPGGWLYSKVDGDFTFVAYVEKGL
jgi:hypothetical protein